LLYEYKFEVAHQVRITNLDANGIFYNQSSSNEDLIWAQRNGNCDKEAILRKQTIVYIIVMLGLNSKLFDQDINEDTDRSQVLDIVYKDLLVLHKL